VLLMIPLAAAAAGTWSTMTSTARGRAVGAVLAPLAALCAYSAYLWWTLGEPFAWTKAQSAWGRSFHVTGVYTAVVSLLTAARHHQGWLFKDAAFCVVYVICLFLAWRVAVARAWIAAGAATVLLPLTSGSFVSDARFGLLALPVYAGLASLGGTRRRDVAVRCVSIALLAAGAATVLLPLWP
jgi:hypothetical protein